MASPSPKSGSKRSPQSLRKSGQNPSTRSADQNPPEIVDPVWLLKSIGTVLIAALVCGYLTLCLLFYQGQWQIVLHPSRNTFAPSTISGTAYETIHFGVDETAAPQLTGWWLPAASGAKYASYTALYLPSGDGFLASSSATLSALHDIGINVFAFDYRGYGQSAATRPNQRRMTEDVASAWQYLTVSRNISPAYIIPFGDGVGVALAVELAASHPSSPAVILQSLRPDLIQIVLADPRTKFLPVHLLFHDRFEIAAPLKALKTPKLLILSDSVSASVQVTAAETAEPKMISTIPVEQFNGSIYREQIVRFLDEYLH